MVSFLHLPAGYTTLQPSSLTTPPAAQRSSLINAEFSHLKKNFPPRGEKVGLCLSNLNKDTLLEYVALCNALQQKNKEIKFYPCFTDPQVLLYFLNVFSFFRPRQAIFKRFFSIVPNEFYRDLHGHERRSLDIKMLASMKRVIINGAHPYLDLIDDSKIIKIDPAKVFIFNLEGERTS